MAPKKTRLADTSSVSKRPQVKLLTEVFGLSFTQAEVDFVVPDLAGDLRLGIDPFLLFKSRHPEYKAAHDRLVAVFNDALRRYAAGNQEVAAQLLDFPEVDEIALGYREHGSHGSGLGKYLNQLLLRTLGESPALLARGVRHVEEMQLVSMGINADRVSDIAANILKAFLIEYTQRQAEKYGIPLTSGVPVTHVFDFDDWDWRDDYYDLPLNPVDPHKRAIILVPRRIVRRLPWINFDDYQRTEFGLFLRSRRTVKGSPADGETQEHLSKARIVAVTRREIERIDHYVDRREREAGRADPELLISATPELGEECNRLAKELESLPRGQKDAYRYQDLMFRVLNLLFEPDLIEGRKQVRTVHGTEIRDLLYTNDSDKPFWDYVRNHHGSLTIVFECKNTDDVDLEDVDQLAGYLGDPLGYFGIFLCREDLSDHRRLKCISWYNKGTPRRVMVALAEDDIIRMLKMRAAGNDPLQIIRYKYQDFCAKVQ